MSLILTLQCDIADCESKIHGAEEISLTEPYPRDFVSMQVLGHLQLNYGEGLRQDLTAAALAAGWHWTGSEWYCLACTRKLMMAGLLSGGPTMISPKALDHGINLGEDGPTAPELEALAHSMEL